MAVCTFLWKVFQVPVWLRDIADNAALWTSIFAQIPLALGGLYGWPIVLGVTLIGLLLLTVDLWGPGTGKKLRRVLPGAGRLLSPASASSSERVFGRDCPSDVAECIRGLQEHNALEVFEEHASRMALGFKISSTSRLLGTVRYVEAPFEIALRFFEESKLVTIEALEANHKEGTSWLGSDERRYTLVKLTSLGTRTAQWLAYGTKDQDS